MKTPDGSTFGEKQKQNCIILNIIKLFTSIQSFCHQGRKFLAVYEEYFKLILHLRIDYYLMINAINKVSNYKKTNQEAV